MEIRYRDMPEAINAQEAAGWRMTLVTAGRPVPADSWWWMGECQG